MTYYEAAKIVLEQSEVPMRVDDIWNKAIELGLDKEIEKTLGGKMSKTPVASLGAKIYTEIKYNPNDTIFIKTGKGKFFLKSKIDNNNQNIIVEEDNDEDSDDDTINNQTINANKILEADLHKPLTQFLNSMKIYSKTINANATDVSIKGKMRWGTPDIVAVTFKDYINKPILELFNHINLPTTQIYAYELKVELKLNNLVQHYFQTLSNSGWANEAWLVAKDIDVDNLDLMEELKRLNQSFGVGIIHLNYDNPEDSNILFSAQKRAYLDIETMDKLCQNEQFKDFIDDVNEILDAPTKSKNNIIYGMIKNNRLNNPN